MNNTDIRKRVLELNNIEIPRIKKDTREVIQNLIFEGSPSSILMFQEFMKLVEMHKIKRINNERFYLLLDGFVEDVETFLKNQVNE